MTKEQKKRSNLREEGPGYRVFTVFNTIFLLIVIFVTAYPVWYVLIASVSDPTAMAENYGLMWLPRFPISFEAYRMVFVNPLVLSGYCNTIFILVVGLIFNMVFTCLGAYVMSLRDSMFRRPISIFIIFTMYFSGGIVPTYLNVQSLGLMNSLWSLILPVAINTYNMLILRSAFMAIPDSLIEVARLDGASHLRILTRIFIPLSGATLAVMVLYYAVGHWNSWFYAMLYIQTPERYPLQVVLRQILLLNKNTSVQASLSDTSAALLAELIKYALIVVSTAPILILYPEQKAVNFYERNKNTKGKLVFE